MQDYLSEQILGSGNELMVDDPVRQQAVLIGGDAGCDRVHLGKHAAVSQRLVAIVGWHAPCKPAGKANQDGLPQLHLCNSGSNK